MLFSAEHSLGLTEAERIAANERWEEIVKENGLEEGTEWYNLAALYFINEVISR